jgi:hypothetical protein
MNVPSNAKVSYGDIELAHFEDLDFEIDPQWYTLDTEPDFDDDQASFELVDLD